MTHRCGPAFTWWGSPAGRRLVRGALRLILVIAPLALPHGAFAADPQVAGEPAGGAEADVPSAVVEIDGVPLFRVRGTTGYPAQARADAIRARIEAVAADASQPADAVTVAEQADRSDIMAGRVRLLALYDSDAKLESEGRSALAQTIAQRTRQAIADYRRARSPLELGHAALRSLAASALLALLLGAGWWCRRRLGSLASEWYARRTPGAHGSRFTLIDIDRAWHVAGRAGRALWQLALLAMVALYAGYELSLFPWTRGAVDKLSRSLAGHLQDAAVSLAREVPSLLVLVAIALGTRYLLSVIKLLFVALERSQLTLRGFQPEWAGPTYKLVRLALICLALTLAYPFIPGSSSLAFRGLSIFLGVIVSLGSSPAISNFIAGYMLLYRGAFKIGDRVRIGETVGYVTEMRLQATHLVTVKHENVTIPNLFILNNEVVNYSARARTQGLILHTTVGIGYETPWRQVHAMLLMAAERTPGLGKSPAPYVHQLLLGDFAVTYELNAGCDDVPAMEELYSALHRNILDVFNEYGVQIMTPAYEYDAFAPKVVPKDQWYLTPARADTAKG